MKHKKKTAIELLLLEFKKRKGMLDNIDDEQAYLMGNIIHLTELYLSNEKKQIIKAYKDGIDDMKILCYWKPKDYFDEYYGK